MRIVQSFWSAKKSLLLNSFGWSSPQYHLMSWALSCLTFKRFYSDIHLYTDKNGYEILIDYLKLPYTSVNLIYENLDEYPEKLFALPKILTYSLQDQPFIHADGDVYLWEKFTPHLENSELVAQNFEFGTDYSNQMLGNLKEKLIFIPKSVAKNISRKSIFSYNAGILGGNDISFLKEYSSVAIDWINKNNKIINSKETYGNFNILFEQILFYSLSSDKNKKVNCYFEKAFNDNEYSQKAITDFTAVPYELKYLHLIGGHKRVKENYELMCRTLFKHFPEYYFKIINLFKEEHLFFNSGIKYHEVIKGHSMTTIKAKPIGGIQSRDNGLSMYEAKKFKHEYRHDKKITEKSSPVFYEFLKYKRQLQKEIKRIKNISKDDLYTLEFIANDFFPFFYKSQKQQLNTILIMNPFINIIETSSNWVDINMDDIILTNTTATIIAIVPDLFFKGYNEVVLDDLSYNIIAVLKTKMSFRQLLQKVKMWFDQKDIDKNYFSFYELIKYKLKFLFYNKCVLIYDEGIAFLNGYDSK